MAASYTELTDLAAKISTNASTITQYLEKNNLPGPSFDKNAPSRLPADPHVQAARQTLIDAALDLFHLATGPADYLFGQSILLKHDQMNLQLLNHYNFWDAVPLDGASTYAEIAAKVGLSESLTHRILRYSIAMRVFRETADGKVEHTATSATPAREPRMKSFLEHNIDELGPACLEVPQAIERWGESPHPSHSALAVKYFPDYPLGDGFFQWMDTDTRNGQEKGYRMKRFGSAMEYFSDHMGISINHVHQGFDWGSLGKGTVVDVGGSVGHISFGLAASNPDLTFIVQDRPGLEAPFNATRPADVASRVSFQAHDFFTEQPVKDADVYFLKHILHDWSDEYAGRIIKGLIPALKPGARVIIMENDVPPFGAVPVNISKTVAAHDMQMLVALNAKERTLAEWEKLFKNSDSRFALKGSIQPPGCIFKVMEFVFSD